MVAIWDSMVPGGLRVLPANQGSFPVPATPVGSQAADSHLHLEPDIDFVGGPAPVDSPVLPRDLVEHHEHVVGGGAANGSRTLKSVPGWGTCWTRKTEQNLPPTPTKQEKTSGCSRPEHLVIGPWRPGAS